MSCLLAIAVCWRRVSCHSKNYVPVEMASQISCLYSHSHVSNAQAMPASGQHSAHCTRPLTGQYVDASMPGVLKQGEAFLSPSSLDRFTSINQASMPCLLHHERAHAALRRGVDVLQHHGTPAHVPVPHQGPPGAGVLQASAGRDGGCGLNRRQRPGLQWGRQPSG